MVYVATENDSVYAFDATSGTLLWHDGPSSLIPGESPVLATDVNCPQIEPTLGITSTPVIDPTTNTMYVVAMSKSVVNGTTTYYQRIHALDLGTGADKVAPHAIDQSISVPGVGAGGNGTSVFVRPQDVRGTRRADAEQRGDLHRLGVALRRSRPTPGGSSASARATWAWRSVANVDPNGTPAATERHRDVGRVVLEQRRRVRGRRGGNLYNISGNGPFDPTQGDYGDAYVKLATTGGTLTIADYFAPSNQQYLSDNDIDLGSSGVVLLPDMTDASGAVRHLMIGSGKDGNIYLLDRDNLGQFNATRQPDRPGR